MYIVEYSLYNVINCLPYMQTICLQPSISKIACGILLNGRISSVLADLFMTCYIWYDLFMLLTMAGVGWEVCCCVTPMLGRGRPLYMDIALHRSEWPALFRHILMVVLKKNGPLSDGIFMQLEISNSCTITVQYQGQKGYGQNIK